MGQSQVNNSTVREPDTKTIEVGIKATQSDVETKKPDIEVIEADIQITIMSTSKKEHILKIKNTIKVSELKQKLRQFEKILPNKMDLIACRRRLFDDEILAKCGIKNGTVVYITLIVKGGLVLI